MSQDLKTEFLNAKRALFDKYYDFLNEKQRQAVYMVQGPLLILAGAGSGKTTVLVNRLAHIIRYGDAYMSDTVPDNLSEHLIEQMQIALTLPREKLGAYLSLFKVNPPAPWQVMAITFTNKAANEIKERISTVFGDNSADDIWSGTFHSVCMRFLRRWAPLLGYNQNFGICDTDAQKSLVTECMRALNIDTNQFPVKSVLGSISREKENLRTPEETRELAGRDVYAQVVAQTYFLYQKRLMDSSLMDFDDIIMNTVTLFQEHDDILKEVQRRFKYLSVDEYQDTNRAQFLLCKLIAEGWRNIMVVGDDDQSIYKFRGATIQNILDFDTVYPETATVKLEQNYRSTSTILGAANAVIAHNKERKGKTLWTEGEAGELISVNHVDTQNDEARYIAETVEKLVAGGGVKYKDIAVLYRTNVQSRSIEQAFVKSAIPYRMLGGFRFFERLEVKDILAYLAVINNPSDTLHLKRIINIPRRGIGDKSVNAATVIAESENVPLFEILGRADRYVAIPPSAAKSMKELYKMLLSFEENKNSLSELISNILTATGYMGQLIKGGEEEKNRIENLEELISTAKQYEEQTEEATLSGFLEEVALVSDVDKYDEKADAVILMTVHSSKGLEFPYVFLPGMEEGLFPGYRSLADPGELEEERRLAYVALTRAKKKIYIIYTHNRMVNGQTQINSPSRFIKEIPGKYCDNSIMNKLNFVFDTKKTKYNPVPQKKAAATFDTFSSGDKVKHTSFGIGTIVSAKPIGGDILYEIDFEKVGKKKLMATYARLTKV